MAKQQRLAREVRTCHEAGAFGNHLHPKLVAMGVRDLVVQPRDRDEPGKAAQSDRIDALALCQRLDRASRDGRGTPDPKRAGRNNAEEAGSSRQ